MTPDPARVAASPVEPLPRMPTDYESQPLSRGEYLQAIIHYYRGEMSRVNAWRLRLDQTTNWAVFTTAALLSFAFSSPQHTHVVLLIGNLFLLLLLGIEARRFRFFDVWRARIRKLEENFYGPILRRNPQSPQPLWGALVADDLLQPRFKVTFAQAFRQRLLKNYIYIFLILYLAWLIKVTLHPEPAQSLAQAFRQMSVGFVPGSAVASVAGAFTATLLALVLYERTHTIEGENWGLQQPVASIDQ